ncbi:MAG: DUF350 domain-containing protein [Vulcanimicrobiota bacterium]
MPEFVVSYLKAFGWAIVASIAMSASMGILLRVYDLMTPIDEWEEIKKGNMACAILMAAVILAFGFVVGMIISTPDTVPVMTTPMN